MDLLLIDIAAQSIHLVVGGIEHFAGLLNNREKAAAIWFAVALVFFSKSRSFRRSLFHLAKAFFTIGILKMVFLMVAYGCVLVYFFWRVGLWDPHLTRETVYWFLTAFALLINAHRASEEKLFFRKIIARLATVAVVFEFLVKFYVFSLLTELLFILVVAFLSLLSIAAEGIKFNKIRLFSDTLLGAFAITLILNSLYRIVVSFQEFSIFAASQEILFPIIFTLLYLPYIYLVALYMLYQTTFIRLSFTTPTRKLPLRVKTRVLFACGINLRKLKLFSKKVRFLRGFNEDEMINAISIFKKRLIVVRPIRMIAR